MNVLYYTLSVAWKEIQQIAKDRGWLAVLFLLPLLLSSLMGWINVQVATSGEDPAILLEVALVNQDSGPFGQQIALVLEEIDELEVHTAATVSEAEQRVSKAEVKAAIIIPADFSAKIDAYTPTAVEVIVDPAEPESAGLVTGIMNRVVNEVIIWGEVQHGVRAILGDTLADAPAEAQNAVAAQVVGVIMTELNVLRQNPSVVVSSEDLEGAKVEGGVSRFLAYLFPAFTVMFAFFVVAASSSALLKERESGTMRRLLAAPIPRGTIIAGKMLAYMLVVCLQVTVLFLVAHFLIGMPLGQSPAALVLLSITLALVAASLGMLVAALARTAKQADNIGVLVSFVLAGIGGSFPLGPAPITRSGGVIGVITKLTPHAHAVDAYYSVMAENAPLVQILPQIGILLVFAVVFFLVAVWRLKLD